MENKEVPRGVKIIGNYFHFVGSIFLFLSPFIILGLAFACFGCSGDGNDFYSTIYGPGFLEVLQKLSLISIPFFIFIISAGVKLKKGKHWAANTIIGLCFFYLIIQIITAIYFIPSFGHNLRHLYFIFRIFDPTTLIDNFSFVLVFFFRIILSAFYILTIKYLLFNEEAKDFFK